MRASPEPRDLRRCPRCGDMDTHRTHRRWYDRLLGRKHLYKCDECKHRFRVPRTPAPGAESRAHIA